MPRNISFSLTTPQFLAGTKDVTRRMGWEFLRVGDILCAVEKGQGLGKGGKVKRLGLIRVIDARREPLEMLMFNWAPYGISEVKREGFPHLTPGEFVSFFCKSHRGCLPSNVITRIEFLRLP